ncbi:AraC family transcriptional regulator [Telluria mixta]|uniref:AraC family transcriptional regulator n=1 Tax=Telluria mixta TaxID=34071 RepID=A0ABT2C193_9BURK|nr:AraC family transcriptional regulator [Telluria mixta]MCS0631134.1 AraC family transcriptional regulator [Telluria mixta]WEM95672.1 AraC family transcriptional regulator [Telluria mixta]
MKHSFVTKPIPYTNHNTALTTVPKVRLYVERPERKENWFVNVGHVTDRGRWRTEPHAHPGYGQVIFVRNGRGVMNLEGSSVPFEAPCALLLPTECVHGLDYEVDVDRWVVTIEVSYLKQVNTKLREFIQLWNGPRIIPFAEAPETAAEFHRLIQALRDEVETRAMGHIVATEALLTSLLLMLVRGVKLDDAANEGAVEATSQELRLTERFRDLIDRHYRDNLQLQDYASKMGVSLVQLRAACAAATGQSPAKLIHARILTEAKRNLIFGDMTMEQIAYSLGFSDAAYFTRFFRKEIGQTPSQFRLAARERP